MKTKQLVFLALLMGSFFTMNGQAYKSAIGVKGGNVLLGSFKHFFGEKLAFEGVAGFGLGSVDADLYMAGYLQLHFPIASVENLTWFAGAGPSLATASFTNSGNSWGVTIIGGADYRIGDTPLNVSADISAPIFFGSVLNFVPYASVAARYIFGEGGGSN